MKINADNRNHARAWLTSLGYSSAFVRALPLAQLKAAWHDQRDPRQWLHETADEPNPPTPHPAPHNEEPAHMAYTPPLDLTPRARRAAPIIEARPEWMDEMDGADHAPQPAPAPSAMTPDATSAAEHLAQALAILAPKAGALDVDGVRAIITEELAKITLPRPLAITVNDKPTVTLPDTRHPQVERLIAVTAAGIPAYIVGPAGSGKTTGAHMAAEALGLDFYTQGAASGAHEYTGYKDAAGVYHTTPFRQAFEHGGVILLDEIDACDPGALMVLQSATANGYMAFPDQPQPVRKHDSFRVIAAANTFGSGADRQYVGRNQLDGATLDRFAQIVWDYDEVLERQIAGNVDWTAYVQRVRRAVSKCSIRHIVSPRASIYGAKMLALGEKRGDVEAMLIWRGLSPQDVARIKVAM